METVKSFTNYYAAKFWREAQPRPLEFIIVPNQRGNGFVAKKSGWKAP